MYKLCPKEQNYLQCVQRKQDGMFIPFVDDNTDYQKYLEWVAEGNTPEPADEPTQG